MCSVCVCVRGRPEVPDFSSFLNHSVKERGKPSTGVDDLRGRVYGVCLGGGSGVGGTGRTIGRASLRRKVPLTPRTPTTTVVVR